MRADRPSDLLSSPAELRKECTRLGLTPDLFCPAVDLFECLLRGLQQQAAVSFDGGNEGDASANADTNTASSAPTHHTALADALADVLKARDMSQADVATTIGLANQAPLSNWLRGVRLSAAKVSEIDLRVGTYLSGLEPGAIGPGAFAAVAPHLAEPSTMAARFARLDAQRAVGEGAGASEPCVGDEDAEAEEDKWTPPTTTRDHAELVSGIKEHLVQSCKTQGQVGSHLGISHSQMSSWISGNMAPGPQRAHDAKVAAYLADPHGVSARNVKWAEARAKRDKELEAERAARAAAHAAKEGVSSSKRQVSVPKRFSPPAPTQSNKAPRITLKHDDFCFNCGDGGELLECTVCPRMYHLSCVGLQAVPKGTWHCPWHSCFDCDRKSSHVGGQLVGVELKPTQPSKPISSSHTSLSLSLLSLLSPVSFSLLSQHLLESHCYSSTA